MTSLTLRKSTNVDDFRSPLTPFGGTARREAGVAGASLTATLALALVATDSIKAKPFGRAARGLDPVFRFGVTIDLP